MFSKVKDQKSTYNYYNWISPMSPRGTPKQSEYFLMKFCLSSRNITQECTNYYISTIHVSIPKWQQTGLDAGCHVTLEIFFPNQFPVTKQDYLQYYTRETDFSKADARDINRVSSGTNFKIYYYPERDEWTMTTSSKTSYRDANKYILFGKTPRQILNTHVYIYETGPIRLRELLFDIWKQFISANLIPVLDTCFNPNIETSSPIPSSSTPFPKQKQRTFNELIQTQLQAAQSPIFRAPTGQLVVIPEQLSTTTIPIASSSRVEVSQPIKETPQKAKKTGKKSGKKPTEEDVFLMYERPALTPEQLESIQANIDLYFLEFDVLELLAQTEIESYMAIADARDIIRILRQCDTKYKSGIVDESICYQYPQLLRLWNQFQEMNISLDEVELWYSTIKETAQLFFSQNDVSQFETYRQIELNFQIALRIIQTLLKRYNEIPIDPIYEPFQLYLKQYFRYFQTTLQSINDLIEKEKKSLATDAPLFKDYIVNLTYYTDFLIYLILTRRQSLPDSPIDKFFEDNKDLIARFALNLYANMSSLIHIYLENKKKGL